MLRPEVAENIEKRALEQRRMKNLGVDNPLGSKIFDMLEAQYGVHLFLYPLKSKNICGFTFKNEDITQVFVNSNMKRCLQNFVCAHELYHVIEHNHTQSDKFIVCDSKDISEDMSETDIDPEELKANYFAASFLLSETVIKERFGRFNVKNVDEVDIILEILKTQHLYEVPYKTILKRLCEVGITSDSVYEKLKTYETDMSKYCRMLDEKMCMNIKYQQEVDKRKYNSLNVSKTAADLYRRSGLSFGKLKQILEKYDKSPGDFGITKEKIMPLGIDFGSFGSGEKDTGDED